MDQFRTRRGLFGQATCFLAVAAFMACGQEPASTTAASPAVTAAVDVAAPPKAAPAPKPAASKLAATKLEPGEIPFKMPDHNNPSLAPKLRMLLETEPVHQRFDLTWRMNPKGIWSNTFLGVRTIQNPLDVWVTHEIMYEVKPDFVVETGTLYGGSAPLWAMFLGQINPEGRVITIDIVDLVTDAKELPIWKSKVDFLVGGSTDPAIVADVKKRVGDGRVMVILDSDHSEEHVFAELQAYAPLVSVGSYLIVQDTGAYYQRPEQKFPGGRNAVKRFLETNDTLEIDLDRERYVLTNNASGFLKRVR